MVNCSKTMPPGLRVIHLQRKAETWKVERGLNFLYCFLDHLFTANVCQPWTNNVNNGNKYLIIGVLFILNIQIFGIYILLSVMPKSLFQVTKMVSDGRKHVSTATTNLPYFTP